MILLLPILVVVMGISMGRGEIDEHEFEIYWSSERKGNLKNLSPVVMVANHEGYLQNCSDCHLSYSPQLLPKRSWEKLMEVEKLEDHFEEYVFLEEEERQNILSYLVNNAAEESNSILSKKILLSIDNETPIRIREVRAIYRRHDLLPKKYTLKNAKVLSLSQCQTCHQQADKGIFAEEDVFIPYESLEDLANQP